MITLTDTERETLATTMRAIGLTDKPAEFDGNQHSWRCEYPDRYGPCSCFADDLDTFAAAVKAILTARLARIEALADEWDRLMDDGLCWCSSSTTDYVALRAALAAPTPDEVQP